ncbi:single-stranded DNA-binding protein [Streptomyces sp. NPDC004838]
MQDTMVTLVGNAATIVEYRESATGGMSRFRMAVTPRRWDRQTETWTDGHTSFYTVFAWRALAANLAGSVSVGDPLVVHGRLKVRESDRDGYGDMRDGPRKTFVDIEAVAVGHDLTRGTSAFRRGAKSVPNPTAEQLPHATGAGAHDAAAGEWTGAARPAATGGTSSLGSKAVPVAVP